MNQKISTWLGTVILIIFSVTGIFFAWEANQRIQSLYSSPAVTTPIKKQRVVENKLDETAEWQTYRNEKYGFELKYPKEWKEKNPNYISSDVNEIPLQDFFANPDIHVLGIMIDISKNNQSLEQYANSEIENNNCPGSLEEGGSDCPEKGPVDHIINKNNNGILYSLYCSHTSEDYVFIIKNQKGNIIRFSYKDDFGDWCEAQKIEKFEKIISTFKFTK